MDPLFVEKILCLILQKHFFGIRSPETASIWVEKSRLLWLRMLLCVTFDRPFGSIPNDTMATTTVKELLDAVTDTQYPASMLVYSSQTIL
jgi:hypothetical protein